MTDDLVVRAPEEAQGRDGDEEQPSRSEGAMQRAQDLLVRGKVLQDVEQEDHVPAGIPPRCCKIDKVSLHAPAEVPPRVLQGALRRVADRQCREVTPGR